jgi:oligoendopeptidase F
LTHKIIWWFLFAKKIDFYKTLNMNNLHLTKTPRNQKAFSATEVASSNSMLPQWDLTQYYSNLNDPKIQSDLKQAKELVDNYALKFAGKVNDLSAQELYDAFVEVESISVKVSTPSYYLHLLYEAGSDIEGRMEEIGKLQSVVDEQTTMISNELTFFDVELAKRKDLETLINSPELKNYKHYLQTVFENGKYILSEDVEKVLSLKSLTSSDAWSRQYTDQKAKIEVELEIYGKKKKYNVPGLMDLMKNSDRKIRATAFEALSYSFSQTEELVLEAYNNIIMDKKIMDGLRGYENAEQSKLISNQISQSFVDSLVKTAQDKVGLLQRYYRMKMEILGLTNQTPPIRGQGGKMAGEEKPKWYDSYAGITFEGLEEKSYSWEECKQIVVENFTAFHPRFGAIAQEAFDKNWLDAGLRKRKYGGAFMSNFAPGYHPVILCNFKNKLTDISTVAHEMGHLVHSILTDESQTLLNTNYTLSMAEIASLCCETVVFEKMYSEIPDDLSGKKLKLKLMCEKVEEEFLNIYVGGVGRYIFESKIHKMYREQGAISKEQIRELWIQEHYVNLFGDIFDYTGCEYSWQSVAHFTYIFYNYVYASGLLTSNAIYNVVKDDESKKAIYLEILAAGGSDSPANLLCKLDLEIESPEFWKIGFDLSEKRLIEAERLWTEVKAEM